MSVNLSVKKKKSNTYTLCMLALLTAMMVLLKMTISIQTPVFKLNFASLPIILGAMVLGPLEGAVVAVVGEFIVQVVGPYGLVPTTFIYVWPPAIRALVVGGAALWVRRSGRHLEERSVLCYAACSIAAILTTIGNTFGMWLESLMYQTSFAVAAFWVPTRFVSGVLTAIVVATVCIPLARALRRSGLLKYAD